MSFESTLTMYTQHRNTVFTSSPLAFALSAILNNVCVRMESQARLSLHLLLFCLPSLHLLTYMLPRDSTSSKDLLRLCSRRGAISHTPGTCAVHPGANRSQGGHGAARACAVSCTASFHRAAGAPVTFSQSLGRPKITKVLSKHLLLYVDSLE